MPDEDQSTGMESTESSQDTISTQGNPPESSQTEESVETIQHDATPINTVGDALDAFQRAQSSGFQQEVVPTTAQPVKPSRDYSGLSPEEQAWFKKMGNDAFDKLKPWYLESKKLKEEHEKLKKDYEEASKSSIFEHEKAYQLSPEFETYSNNVASLDAEISHWQQQLAAIRQGQNWTPIVLGADGKPTFGEPQEPTPEAEAVVINAMTQAHIYKTDLGNKISNIRTSFGQQHQTFVGRLNEITDKIFQGVDKQALDKAISTKLPIFPSSMRGRPEIRALAAALAVIEGMSMQLRAQKSAANTATIKSNTAMSAGPRTSDIKTASGKPATVASALKAFEDARAQGMF